MAKITGPIDHALQHEMIYELLNPVGNNSTLTNAIVFMTKMDKKAAAKDFIWSDDDYNLYMQSWLQVQSKLFKEEKYDDCIYVYEKAINFINCMEKKSFTTKIMVMHTAGMKTFLKLGKKDDAKRILLNSKKYYDEGGMNQPVAKYLMYVCYHNYYRHPLTLNSSKLLHNGFLMLSCALTFNVITSTAFLVRLAHFIDETISVRAFRQSNYLLRAFKVFLKANKDETKICIFLDQIKSGELPALESMLQLGYIQLMLKILVTMKELAIAEKQLDQGKVLDKNQKSGFKIIEKCYKFENIEVPEKDEILDGLLKGKDEIKLICRKIQKKLKAVETEEEEMFNEIKARCLAELKDVEEFFKIHE